MCPKKDPTSLHWPYYWPIHLPVLAMEYTHQPNRKVFSSLPSQVMQYWYSSSLSVAFCGHTNRCHTFWNGSQCYHPHVCPPKVFEVFWSEDGVSCTQVWSMGLRSLSFGPWSSWSVLSHLSVMVWPPARDKPSHVILMILYQKMIVMGRLLKWNMLIGCQVSSLRVFIQWEDQGMRFGSISNWVTHTNDSMSWWNDIRQFDECRKFSFLLPLYLSSWR